jgi:transcription elongation factor Elf1
MLKRKIRILNILNFFRKKIELPIRHHLNRKEGNAMPTRKSAFRKDDLIECIQDAFGEDVPIMYQTGYYNFTDWCEKDKNADLILKRFVSSSTGKHTDMFIVLYNNNSYWVESVRRQAFIYVPNNVRENLTIRFKEWLNDMTVCNTNHTTCGGACGRKLFLFDAHVMMFNLLYNVCGHCKSVICNQCVLNTKDQQFISKCHQCNQSTHYDFEDVDIKKISDVVAVYVLENRNAFDKKEVLEWRACYPEYHIKRTLQ